MNLNKIVEALLFASREPVDSKKIAKIIRKVSKREEADQELCSVKYTEIDEVIEKLNKGYDRKKSPYLIQERSTGWRIYTRIDYASYIRELFPDQKPTRLSAPALETLAIVAYRQPITKAAIEAVRGVNVDGVLQSLIERGLVSIAGRSDLPGKPFLYETSRNFLEHFGIKDVEDLPNSAELRSVDLPQPESEKENDEQLSLSEVAKDSQNESESTENENTKESE
ncbi:MAG: SMC-Scp complex subunit ScpB [Verrucomicrobiota bacterium]|jgi:segregation and condensation protein B|nr:SMC-Scp complex subunit ScpB [Verrucomicrobiales bacterium]MBB26668.1 SMC-Scp complex subunit ScpB [Verrucomicrobiaceae bacterium]MEC9041727.1 SMC-Scp complex subunit ScpB [Verrucomicrobiota bacterium]MEC9111718.1 SMC-Scp complex subunit ScpB [Verrucomicrobiota bacterium]MED5258405.1 SMC-Scp complex subunit ScpB [Verrucomicrobiota bacterium]|tara:strand:- start:3938 stop:4612 length:675 start_codon:yes stop_codon:yes gene_type:complete